MHKAKKNLLSHHKYACIAASWKPETATIPERTMNDLHLFNSTLTFVPAYQSTQCTSHQLKVTTMRFQHQKHHVSTSLALAHP